jgi:FkbM family methyltransferase
MMENSLSKNTMKSDIDPLFELLKPDRPTAIVDVGANPIDGDPPYKQLLQKRLCRVVGFEPQADALAKLTSRKSELETYLPYVVGNGDEAKLKICRARGMTSILNPDQHMLSQFPNFSRWGKVVEETLVATRRLDDIGEIESLDFLKIDIQGAELSVFQHGQSRLKEAVAIQTEVSFLPLYKDQPIFGEIDLELRKQGFVPHAFAAIKKWMIGPLRNEKDPFAAFNQLLEADVVYVRDFTRPDGMKTEQLKHLALIAHHCYGSFDLVMNCIQHLVGRKAISPDARDSYLTICRTK